MDDKDLTRRAIALVAGFLSGDQLRALADSTDEIANANAHLGTRSQAVASIKHSANIDQAVDSLCPFYHREIAEKLRRAVEGGAR